MGAEKFSEIYIALHYEEECTLTIPNVFTQFGNEC